MGAAIVYYSMGGNTAMAAKMLAEGTDADLIEIRPEKPYPDRGIRKFLSGGKSAVAAETPKLAPYIFLPDKYDLIVFGFPIWAGNLTPPLRTFVRENRETLEGKRVAAFACRSGNGGEKAFVSLRSCLGNRRLEATMTLNDPKDRPNPENAEKIATFRAKILMKDS